MGRSIPGYSQVPVGVESSQNARSLGHCLRDLESHTFPAETMGAVTSTGARGPRDIIEHLPSQVGRNHHPLGTPGFKTYARLEIRLSVHSPLAHREMAQRLRELAALPEVLSSIPSNHMVSYKHL